MASGGRRVAKVVGCWTTSPFMVIIVGIDVLISIRDVLSFAGMA